MRGQIAVVMAFIGLALSSGSACAVNLPSQASPHCRVIGSEKLPPASGGSEALCAAIEEAASARAPGVAYNAEVRVLSSSMLTATLTIADGRILPEQKYAVMDREITKTSFKRFAAAIADALDKAARR